MRGRQQYRNGKNKEIQIRIVHFSIIFPSYFKCVLGSEWSGKWLFLVTFTRYHVLLLPPKRNHFFLQVQPPSSPPLKQNREERFFCVGRGRPYTGYLPESKMGGIRMYHVLARWPYNVCISLEKRGRYSQASREGRGDGCSQSSSVKDYYM